MPALSKQQIRERTEKARKQWEKKGGKTTKLPTRTATGAATPPSSSSRSGKGPMGSGGGLNPQGTVKSYTWPKGTAPGGAAIANVKEAQKKKAAKKEAEREAARVRNAKKAAATKKEAAAKKKAEAAKKKAEAVKNNGTKPANNNKNISRTGSKLPVPVKILKEAARSGAIDDLARAMGKYSGQIRKWFRQYTGSGSTKPQSNKLPGNLSQQVKRLPVPTKTSGGGPFLGRGSPKTSGGGPFLGRGPKKTGPSSIPKTKQPTRWGKGVQAAVRTAPVVVAVGELGGKGVEKGRGTHTPYSVKKGDTLSEIARDKGTTLKALLAANNIKAKDANKLRIGQKLVLPGKVKDRKSVYQGMTKSQMAAMHMPKTKPKRSQTIGEGNIDPLHGTTRKNKHDVSKYSDMTKKKPIKKKPIKKKPIQDRYKYFGKPGETIGDISRKLEIKYDTKPPGSLPHEEGYVERNNRGGQIKGYKKGGKVKKVRKASRPRGVGIALRGWGKAMR